MNRVPVAVLSLFIGAVVSTAPAVTTPAINRAGDAAAPHLLDARIVYSTEIDQPKLYMVFTLRDGHLLDVQQEDCQILSIRDEKGRRLFGPRQPGEDFFSAIWVLSENGRPPKADGHRRDVQVFLPLKLSHAAKFVTVRARVGLRVGRAARVARTRLFLRPGGRLLMGPLTWRITDIVTRRQARPPHVLISLQSDRPQDLVSELRFTDPNGRPVFSDSQGGMTQPPQAYETTYLLRTASPWVWARAVYYPRAEVVTFAVNQRMFIRSVEP